MNIIHFCRFLSSAQVFLISSCCLLRPLHQKDVRTVNEPDSAPPCVFLDMYSHGSGPGWRAHRLGWAGHRSGCPAADTATQQGQNVRRQQGNSCGCVKSQVLLSVRDLRLQLGQVAHDVPAGGHQVLQVVLQTLQLLNTQSLSVDSVTTSFITSLIFFRNKNRIFLLFFCPDDDNNPNNYCSFWSPLVNTQATD